MAGTVLARPVADDDDRPLGLAQQSAAACPRIRRRRDLARGDSPGRGAGLGVRGSGLGLHLVGEDQVRDAAVEDGALAGQVHQLGVAAVVQDGLRPLGHLAEGAHEIDLLERAGTEDLRVHLAGQGDGRSAVHVGVPQAGEQVGRAGAGDGEAGRRPAGELAVGAGRERRRALVPDPVVAQTPLGLLAPEGVGQPQVGVADHAEHVAHAPGDHRLGHHVGHGALVLRLLLEGHVHAVVALLDVEGLHAVVEAGRLARERVVVPAVPGAAQQAVLDGAFAQRAALVRALVVEGAELALDARHADRLQAAGDGLDASLGQLLQVEGLVPDELLLGGHGCSGCLVAQRAETPA